MKNTLPLKEVSILEIYNGEKATYEVPIYQRNYAWGQDEISTLIQDVYDASSKNTKTIYNSSKLKNELLNNNKKQFGILNFGKITIQIKSKL